LRSKNTQNPDKQKHKKPPEGGAAMRQKNKITAILKDTTGVSLMFVLGVMMMLLLIGASLLVAASSNVGTNIRQNEFNRVMLMSNSIHRNIMYSLQADPENEGLLANQLAWIIYEAHDDDIEDITLKLDMDADIPASMSVSIILSIPFHEVRISESSDYFPGIEGSDYYDEEGNHIVIEAVPEVPRVPETANIKAEMLVTVVIESDAMIREGSRLVTTQAAYEYRGGFLTDDPFGMHQTNPNPTGLEMAFAPDGFGIWSLISYETVESQVDVD